MYGGAKEIRISRNSKRENISVLLVKEKGKKRSDLDMICVEDLGENAIFRGVFLKPKPAGLRSRFSVRSGLVTPVFGSGFWP